MILSLLLRLLDKICTLIRLRFHSKPALTRLNIRFSKIRGAHISSLPKFRKIIAVICLAHLALIFLMGTYPSRRSDFECISHKEVLSPVEYEV